MKGQENGENALATIKKQKDSFQERGQLLIDDLEELYNFGVSLEILPPDLYFKWLLSTTKERFNSLSQAPLGHTYQVWLSKSGMSAVLARLVAEQKGQDCMQQLV